MSLFSDLNFLLKFIALICDIVVAVLWLISGKDYVPSSTFAYLVLFYHAAGGYLVVLSIFVVLYFVDEPPSQCAHRIYIGIGLVLFLICGVVGLINSLDGNGGGMLTAILMIVIGVLLIIDMLKSEGIF